MPFPYKQQSNATTTEKVVGALSYLTSGLAGLIYIIISRSSYQSNFFRFHFLQSIVLGIISILLSYSIRAFGTIAPALASMPGVETALWIGASAFGLLPIYGLIFCLLGKYAEIPWLSDVVRNQMR